MIETMITLGNRKYRVAYEEGQEKELAQAVSLFNKEIETLAQSNDQIRENQLLMLSGLMMSYRLNELNNEKGQFSERTRDLENEVAKYKVQAKSSNAPTAELQVMLDKLKAENRELHNEKMEAIEFLTKLEDEVKTLKSETSSNDATSSEIQELELLRNEVSKLRESGSVGDESAQKEIEILRAQVTELKANDTEKMSEANINFRKKFRHQVNINNALREEIKSLKSAEPVADKSAEDGLASMLGEIVGGLESLAKK